MHLPIKTRARRVQRIRATSFLIISAFATPVILPFVQTATSQTTSVPAQLKVGGEVSTPLTLTVTDLKNMPRTTLHVANPHEKKSETYEGVSLQELLRRAGAPMVNSFEPVWPG
jgi:DMSO/TMAO reductase YedYZ molybdopterin-dependent catalytic subunit